MVPRYLNSFTHGPVPHALGVCNRRVYKPTERSRYPLATTDWLRGRHNRRKNRLVVVGAG